MKTTDSSLSLARSFSCLSSSTMAAISADVSSGSSTPSSAYVILAKNGSVRFMLISFSWVTSEMINNKLLYTDMKTSTFEF